jgi:ribonuclease P protein component
LVEKKTFTKRDRIRNKSDFERLRKSGAKSSDDAFLTVILENDLGYSRLGLAVPKRIGNAVARNRIKRLIREAFRLNRDSLPGSIDLLVVVKKPLDNPSLGQFSDRILSLVARYAANGKIRRSKPGGKTDV